MCPEWISYTREVVQSVESYYVVELCVALNSSKPINESGDMLLNRLHGFEQI